MLNTPSLKEGVWPLLNRMLDAKCIDYIDHALAHRFAAGADECLAALLCFLSIAARQGHLCIIIEGKNIIPSPEDVFSLENSVEALPKEDIAAFHLMILEAAVQDSVNEGLHHLPIKKEGNHYYLQRFWHLETFFLKQLSFLLSHNQPRIAVDTGQAALFIETLKLLPEQQSAVLQACRGGITLITGGPGTGKTYTAGMLLKTLWQGMSPELQRNCRISLAAPTGKAAANLEAGIRKLNCPEIPASGAKTLHQLLQVHRFPSKSRHVLAADIILVDECSMIDVNLMGQLLAAIKPGARLIMLGDKDQLPSVEAGSLFADLAEHLMGHEETKLCVVELKTCLRAESQQIIELAEYIKAGNAYEVIRLLSSPQEETAIQLISTHEEMSDKELQQILLKRVLPHFPVFSNVPEDLLHLLKQTFRFQMLSPMRKGPLGVDHLNEVISKTLRPRMQRAGCEITPIMVTQNDYRLELFNGEVGLLISEGNKSTPYGVFFSRGTGEEVRKIPALMLPRFELAYCLSVHKSQGSEFNHVLLVLPKEAELFGRAALYTGATRARRQLDVLGDPVTIERMLSVTSRRQSGVVHRTSFNNKFI
ncbi:MAG: exodeoxyribonuclease V subunit alpha [Parachlamydiaceae bacterium]